MRLNDALRRLPQKATSLRVGSDIACGSFVSKMVDGYIEAARGIGKRMSLREITLDDIESLAVGAWVLGTGGGGSPYLGLLNLRQLYAQGHRVQLMSPLDLDDDDRV